MIAFKGLRVGFGWTARHRGDQSAHITTPARARADAFPSGVRRGPLNSRPNKLFSAKLPPSRTHHTISVTFLPSVPAGEKSHAKDRPVAASMLVNTVTAIKAGKRHQRSHALRRKYGEHRSSTRQRQAGSETARARCSVRISQYFRSRKISCLCC